MNLLDLRTFLFFVCLKGKLVNFNLLSLVYYVNSNPLVFFLSLENNIVLLSGHVQAKKKERTLYKRQLIIDKTVRNSK